jgi:amino acid adenylation domain-containing protein
MMLDKYAIEVLGPDSDAAAFTTTTFIGLGGDSLRAMRLAALVQGDLRVRVPVAALLGDAPLADVLAAVDIPDAVLDAPADVSEVDVVPLTHAQRGMWLIERFTGGSPYNLVFTCHVDRGTVEPELFGQAVAATVARHPGLRTVFRDQAGDVVTDVLDTHVPKIEVVRHDGGLDGFEEHVRAVVAEQGPLPFDLTAAPAYRFLLAENPAGRQAVVLIAHHVVLDGWSVGLLLTEVFGRYDALEQGAPEPVTGPGVSPHVLFRHQEAARTSGAWDEQAEFWTRHLTGVPTVLELPADRPRPVVQEASGDRAAVDLGRAASAAVTERARALGITPFTVLLGAFALTLSRRTGVRSLLVGVPLAGRGTSELAELVAVTGNLVPVRIDVDDDAMADDYLRAVHGSLGLAIDAGDLPFEELVTRLGVERSRGCHPLVQVSFGMHDQLVPQRLRAEGLDIRVEEGHGGGSQFDLSLLIGRAEPSFAGHLEYATGVYGRTEVDGFVEDFRAAVEQVAAAGDTALEEVRCLSAAGRARLDAVNDTRRDFPDVSVDDLFREVARKSPDAVAVREDETELTYAELAAAAARQAFLLREAGVRPGDRVLIGVPRSIAEVVGVLGVVWAGAAYVGVDLGAPAEHTDKILVKAAPAAALVTPDGVARVEAHGIPVVPTWEPDWPSTDDVPGSTGSDGVAYVAFTSGSTGQPKGVRVPHRAVVRLVHEADYVRLGAGERVLRLSPLAFDASTLEFWGALLTGAELEVHPAGLPTPSELGRFVQERGVTVAWFTAGLFRLVEEFAADTLGGLRQLLSGGDVVPHEHVARVLRRNPGLVVTNGYGPTENTTFTTTHSVRHPDEVDGPLPIGTPLPGTRVYVLDERARLVPPGSVGELYTGGAGLADGYLDDEAATARAFGHFSPDVAERLYRTGDVVRLDTAGALRFLGRRDDQVKLRGYRVELSAISDALAAHPTVRDAVVVATDGDSAEKRLLAAVVPHGTAAAVALRDFLAERLPSYMVPTLWAVVDRIPLTGNGKVDRVALAAVAAPAGASPRLTPAPADDGQAGVTALFAEAIGDDKSYGADADFFTVGGNSMAAVKLVRLVEERTGARVRLRDFLRNPTPAGLRVLVEKATSTEDGR